MPSSSIPSSPAPQNNKKPTKILPKPPIQEKKEIPKMSAELDIVQQFSQIGQLLKAQFEQAEKSKKEMDAIVASVKAEAQAKLENLDKTFFDKIQKNEQAITKLETAVNAFSKKNLPRIDKLEKEIGLIEEAHITQTPQTEKANAATAKTVVEETKGSKISQMETSLTKQAEAINKITEKLKKVGEEIRATLTKE